MMNDFNIHSKCHQTKNCDPSLKGILSSEQISVRQWLFNSRSLFSGFQFLCPLQSFTVEASGIISLPGQRAHRGSDCHQPGLRGARAGAEFWQQRGARGPPHGVPGRRFRSCAPLPGGTLASSIFYPGTCFLEFYS